MAHGINANIVHGWRGDLAIQLVDLALQLLHVRIVRLEGLQLLLVRPLQRRFLRLQRADV